MLHPGLLRFSQHSKMQVVFRFGGSEFWICVHKISEVCLFPRAAFPVTTSSWAASNYRDLFCPSSGGWTSDIQVLAGLVPFVALRKDLVQGPPPASPRCWKFLFSGLWTHHPSAFGFSGLLLASLCVSVLSQSFFSYKDIGHWI